ncbi:MAG: TonB-dependent receptor [Methylococcales bacterium]|nr:TonB-dependent receptor [Methylococcales bacterium]
MRKSVYGVIGLFSLSSLTMTLAQDKPTDLGVIDVISTSPLSGSEIESGKLPAHIQHVDADQLQKAQTISLADYMDRFLSGVSTNEAQSNPLQPDIFYRGFVASPLLGMPQGLSTYINGVRFNEPFGDTVNWDLIPQNAIDSMTLYSGSNPVYGLNSLGGAISAKTKTGFSAPLHQLEVYGGSWDRHSEELTSGWNNDTWGYFLDLHHFEDGGWRNHSATKAEQAFGTLSWRGDKGSLDLSLAANDNNMTGNGAAPVQLLQQNRKAVFTHPDSTTTKMFFSELQGSYDVTDKIEVSGNAYFRQNRMKSFNGDSGDYASCAAPDQTEDQAAAAQALADAEAAAQTAADNLTAVTADNQAAADSVAAAEAAVAAAQAAADVAAEALATANLAAAQTASALTAGNLATSTTDNQAALDALNAANSDNLTTMNSLNQIAAARQKLLCTPNDVAVIDTNGNQVDATSAVQGAINNYSQTNMRSRGGTVQTVFANDLFKHENNLTTGVSYDYSEVNFSSDTELASLTDTRATTRSNIFIDESKVRLHTNTSTVGVFLTDSFSITDKLTATVAGRYNSVHVNLKDEYINDPTKTLNGSHTFERFNPSAGLTYQALSNLNLYGNYSESTRAPSPVELSCADPQAPCKLPNSFVSDPDLKQVVANTWETGVRGDLDNLLGKGGLKWNLGFFHTINNNDIIFRRDAASSTISQGYFDNVGKTRRYGIEAGTSADYPQLFSSIDDWHFATNYTYLNARFLTPFDGLNPRNPNEIAVVHKGSKIPGIPEHIFKAAVNVDLWQKFSVGINGQYSGDRYLRGDEANRNAKSSGYWLFNATADYKVTKNFTIFGKLDNIFDKNYNSFGVYGNATQVLGNSYNDGRFFSPGMPRAGWIGVRLSL